MTNFMLQDLTGACRAVAGFAPLLFCPGYLVAGAAEAAGFTRKLWAHRSGLERAAWAVGLSFATSPLLAYFAARWASVGFAAALFAAAALVAAALAGFRIVRARLTPAASRRLPRLRHAITAGPLLGGTLLVLLSLVDVQAGHHLYQSVTVIDQGYRVQFTDALLRNGVPPANPLYYPGGPTPLRYYYVWYLLCAVSGRLAHATARQALIASSVWAGIGLAALVGLFTRFFLGHGNGARSTALRGCLLLGVTGLDLLAVAANALGGAPFTGDLEWWSADQISSWLDTVLWVPNHLASLLGCLMAFLLLWLARASHLGSRRRAALAAGAAWAAAGAFGASIYVAAGFLLLVLAWTALLATGRESTGDSQPLPAPDWPAVCRNLASVALCGLLLLPLVSSLLRAPSGTQAGGSAGATHLLTLGVRHMVDPAAIPAPAWFGPAGSGRRAACDLLLRLALLVPGYIVELGCFGLVLVLACSAWHRLDTARRTAVFLSVSGLCTVTFIRSAVIVNNDFGYRAALLPSFFLLLLAADGMQGLRRGVWTLGRPRTQGLAALPAPGSDAPASRRLGALIVVLLVLGAAGTLFQAAALRFYLPYRVTHPTASAPQESTGMDHLPAIAYAERETFRKGAMLLGNRAVVQGNPAESNSAQARAYLSADMLLYAGHQLASNASADCGAVFGGDPAPCPSLRADLATLFADPAPHASEAQRICRTHRIDALVVTSADPAWNDAQSWVWSLPVLARSDAPSGESVRLLACTSFGVGATEKDQRP